MSNSTKQKVRLVKPLTQEGIELIFNDLHMLGFTLEEIKVSAKVLEDFNQSVFGRERITLTKDGIVVGKVVERQDLANIPAEARMIASIRANVGVGGCVDINSAEGLQDDEAIIVFQI